MHKDAPNHSRSASSELLQIITDFSSTLLKRKQDGCPFLPVLESSKTLMKTWGNESPSGELFLFEGPLDARVFIVDSEGSFFQKEAGQLLVKILGAMKLPVDRVFICSAQDTKSIHAKIKEISPKVIVTLGAKAGQSLLNTQLPLEQFAGKFHEYHGVKVMPTFHPSKLLKQLEYKRQVWDAMKQVMAYAGLNRD